MGDAGLFLCARTGQHVPAPRAERRRETHDRQDWADNCVAGVFGYWGGGHRLDGQCVGSVYDELHDHGDINGQAFTRLYANDGQDASGNAIARGTAYKVLAPEKDKEGVCIEATQGTETLAAGGKVYTLQGTEILLAAIKDSNCATGRLVVSGAVWETAMKAAQRLSGLNNVVTSLLPFIVTLSFIVTVFAKGFLREGNMGSIKEILVKEVVILFATLAAIYLTPSLFQPNEHVHPLPQESKHRVTGAMGPA